MADPRMALRAIVVYAVCLPLALFLGYMLANPLAVGTVTLFGTLIFVLSTPVLLRYHYELMLLFWNMAAVFSFLPGRPDSWLLGILLSFGVSFTHRILDKKVQFLAVPSVARPLFLLGAVVVATALLRGGFGLRSMGGEEVGGKRYILVLVGILGFFAITVRQIPKQRVLGLLGLFLLGRTLAVLGDLYNYVPSFLHPVIFALFPPSAMEGSEQVGGMIRFGGLATAAGGVFAYLMARHGIRKMLTANHWIWFALLCLSVLAAAFGGFRSVLIMFALVFVLQFWLEGMFRTKWPLFFLLAGILVSAAVYPFTDRLPLSIQRTLAFLPVEIDPQARSDAEGSSEWRVQMWRAAVADIPKYLFLGKGYLITKEDFAYMTAKTMQAFTAEDRGSYLAGDFHNGPLSVIIPLGLGGMVAFLWFLYAGWRILVRNYRDGDPAFRTINTYLLAAYSAQVLMFFFVFGGITSQLVIFAGLVGFSAALNGGVAVSEVAKAAPDKVGAQPSSQLPKPRPPRRLGMPG